MIRRLDVWSVFKFSAVFYLALAAIVFVAGLVLWLGATAVGIRENIEKFIGDLIASKEFHFVGTEVLRVAAISSLLMVLLGTALNVFLAVLYNLISELTGGISVTVDDEELDIAPAPATVLKPAPTVETFDLPTTTRGEPIGPTRSSP